MAETRPAPELGSSDRAVAMRRFPGAGVLASEQLAVLASVARSRVLRRGELLGEPDRPVAAIHVVVSGSLVASGGVTAPEVVGTLELLAHAVSGPAYFAGPSGAVLLEVALEDLEDVIEEVPAVLVQLAAHVGSQALALGERTERPVAGAPPLVIPDRPLDLVERLLVLRRCAALSGLGIDPLADLADIATEVKVAPNERAWTSREQDAALVVIAAGELEVRGPRASARLGPGDMAGEAEVMARARWVTDAVARAPTLALFFSRDPLLDVWEDDPSIGLALLRNVAASILASRQGG